MVLKLIIMYGLAVRIWESSLECWLLYKKLMLHAVKELYPVFNWFAQVQCPDVSN